MNHVKEAASKKQHDKIIVKMLCVVWKVSTIVCVPRTSMCSPSHTLHWLIERFLSSNRALHKTEEAVAPSTISLSVKILKSEVIWICLSIEL